MNKTTPGRDVTAFWTGGPGGNPLHHAQTRAPLAPRLPWSRQAAPPGEALLGAQTPGSGHASVEGGRSKERRRPEERGWEEIEVVFDVFWGCKRNAFWIL